MSDPDASRGFATYGLHHAADARAEINYGDVPILDIEFAGGWATISPGERANGITEDHERFANELVTAAEQYRDAIEGARFWADFDQPPADAEGVA